MVGTALSKKTLPISSSAPILAGGVNRRDSIDACTAISDVLFWLLLHVPDRLIRHSRLKILSDPSELATDPMPDTTSGPA